MENVFYFKTCFIFNSWVLAEEVFLFAVEYLNLNEKNSVLYLTSSSLDHDHKFFRFLSNKDVKISYGEDTNFMFDKMREMLTHY